MLFTIKTVKQKSQNPLVSVARYVGLTVTLPVTAFAGYAVGYGLDHLFGTGFLRIVCLILGVVGGLLEVLRELTRDR